MRFGVLGPLAVWTTGGDPVAVPGLKVRALLADLLVHGGRPVPADRLTDDLWGDEPPGNPAGALSAKVSQLRRALEDAEPGGRELVESPPPGYLLRVDADAVDARRFQSLAARARRTDDLRTKAALLADALALWRGPALADFGDEPFARAAIARLEEQRLTAAEEQAEVRLGLGEHAVLAGELGDLLAVHPLRERLRAAHMRALYRAGRQSEALASYEDLRVHLAEDLGLDPGSDLAALRQAILTRDPALDLPPDRHAPSAPSRSNLPTPLTDLIGREDAVADVRARLETDRLVTLTGPGGVGKTRLAVETGRQLVDTFTDGVRLVELAGFDQVGAAMDALTDVVMTDLEIRDTGAEPVALIDRLAGALRPRQTLLVLDNCEHVIERVADLVELLLRAAPGLRILATSREPLALVGEVIWDVPPLEVPDRTAAADPAVLEQSSAVRLFVARAAAAAQGFTLTADTARAVAVLCQRLDGIPLALELAATRVRALGVHGLVARLDDRFRLLATGHRGAPPRQQTLTAMIDWSWELLTEAERMVLRRLAVHADGCTVEAAESVCTGRDRDDVPAADVVGLLARLVDRSLVVMADRGSDGPRYRLLESVAAYCLERMHEVGEYEQVRQRHHRYYTELAERAEPHLYGPDQRWWLQRLDAEAANLRGALDGAVADGHADRGLRLANATAWYGFLRGRMTEARRALEAAMDIPGAASPAVRARGVTWHTGISLLQGDRADWPARRRAALRPYEDLDEPGTRARAEWFLAYVGIDVGALAEDVDLLNRALATFRTRGDRWGVAAALVTRAKHAHIRADLAALERDGEQSAKLFGELGDRWGQLQATAWLGGLAEMAGDYGRAGRLHRDGLCMAEELGLWPEVAARLAWLGWIALQVGDYAQARDYCERALRLATEQNYRPGEIFAEIGLGFGARKEGRLDVAATHLRNLVDGVPQQEGPEPAPPLHLSMVLIELGFVAEQRGDAATARASHLDGFAVAHKLDGLRDMALALEGLAGALMLAGRHADAAQLLGAAAAARESAALPLAPSERGDVDRIRAGARAALGEDAFAAEFARGGALTPDEARAVAGRS